MSIQELSLRFKALITNQEILLALLIVAVSLISFVLGRVSVGESLRETSNIQKNETAQQAEVIETSTPHDPKKQHTDLATQKTKSPGLTATNSEGGYVASKNGTKYHLPWCGSAKQIKEENKIYFATKEEAEKAGYTPASNCKGI